MIIESNEFQITTHGFGELAQLYLPNIKPKSASTRLSAWINKHEELNIELSKIGYKKGEKILSPKMVQTIVDFLGAPI